MINNMITLKKNVLLLISSKQRIKSVSDHKSYIYLFATNIFNIKSESQNNKYTVFSKLLTLISHSTEKSMVITF